VPPLDDIPRLSAHAVLSTPAGACPNCWKAWLIGPRSAIGYCWHGKVAWRVKSSVLSVVPEVTREEHRVMLEYVSEMEDVMRPNLISLMAPQKKAPVVT
jgi:hypothetical protein